MSGEPDAVVRSARQAFAELSDPAVRLLSDFAAAEDGAGALEPELLLLELDVFGGITLPARAASGEDERRARRAQAALARLAGTAGGAKPAPDTATQPGRAPGLPGSGLPRGSSPAAASTAADAEPLPPVFPLRGGTAAGPVPGGTTSGATEPPAVPAAAVRAPAGLGVASTGTPAAAALGADVPEATGGTLELIGQLTEAILAAKTSAEAAAPSTSREPATPAADTGTESAFLVETLRSLGDETAAAFGIESAGAPVRAAPSPATEMGEPSSQPDLGAPPATGGAAPELGASAAPGVAENGIALPAVEPGADPAALAALVNDALVEQARRHGLELG